MNKQNQELRSLSQIVQENSQEILDDFLSKELEVLSESPLYSNSTAIDQYKDLLYMIDFTKIADMLHLITHYGAVSEEQYRNFERSIEVRCTKCIKNNDNQKKAADLLVKRMYTEKYLKYYGLQEIDCSLNEMFPNPIGLHDEHRWYTVASRMLLNEFRSIDLKIDENSNKLHFTNDCNNRRFDFSISSFAEFLEIVLHTSKIFDYQLDWSKKDLTRFVISLVTNEQFRTIESQLED